MPWCTTCDRFYNPNTLRPDGTCPTCGRQVADPSEVEARVTAVDTDPDAPPEKLRRFSDEPAPWHFKVLLAGVVGYLGWRLIQGLGWVVEHL